MGAGRAFGIANSAGRHAQRVDAGIRQEARQVGGETLGGDARSLGLEQAELAHSSRLQMRARSLSCGVWQFKRDCTVWPVTRRQLRIRKREQGGKGTSQPGGKPAGQPGQRQRDFDDSIRYVHEDANFKLASPAALPVNQERHDGLSQAVLRAPCTRTSRGGCAPGLASLPRPLYPAPLTAPPTPTLTSCSRRGAGPRRVRGGARRAARRCRLHGCRRRRVHHAEPR